MKRSTILMAAAITLFTQTVNAQLDVLGKNQYGRTFDVTYDKNTPDTIYGITTSSHIVFSKDNGATWDVFYSLPEELGGSLSKLKITDDGSSLTFATTENSVGIVAVLDIASRTITKKFALPNTYDYPSPYVSTYSFAGNDINTLLVASQWPIGFGAANKVFYTQDGGSTWDQLYYSVDNSDIITNTVAVHPADKEKLYILNGNGKTDADGGLLISTDAGETLTETLAGNVLSSIGFDPSNQDHILIGSGISFGQSPEALFQTTDGGIHWDTTGINWNTDGILNDINTIQFDPFNANHILVLEEDEIAASTDGGLTWQNTAYPYDNLDSYYYGFNLSFNPYKQGELFITANYFPLFSNDGAATFSQVKTPFFVSTGRVGFFENSENKHLFYSVQSGFVHRNISENTDEGYQIQDLNIFTTNDAPIYIADTKTDGRIYSFKGSFFGNSLNISNDYGATFNLLTSSFTRGLTNIEPDPQVSNQIWTAYDNNGLGQLDKVNFNDPENVEITTITLPEENTVYNILHPTSDTNNYFILLGGKLYKTTDGGSSWTLISIEGASNDIQLYDITQNKVNPQGLAIGSSGGVFISNDGGNTWSKSSDFMAHQIFYSDVNSGVLVAATRSTQYTLFQPYYSIDNGTTWSMIPRSELLETGSTSIAVDFSEGNAYLYIASSDTGILGYNVSFTPLASSEPALAKSDIQIYPNPASDIVHIKSDKVKSVNVFNMVGQKVAGSDSSEINISALPKGIYILRIVTTDHQSISKKLIKK